MNYVKIADFKIGPNFPPFIVAEAGINHNGQISTAFEMINLAKNSGANAIKFQTFKAEEFITDPDEKYSYFSLGKEITESMLEMFKRCEFSDNEWFQIKQKCDEEKILFLSTPQNKSDLDLLMKLGIPAVKVGSDDFTNIPLLKDYAATGLPLILSCGMSNLSEISQTLDAVGALTAYPTILLLTTSQYPTPFKDVNLRKFETLSNSFPMIPLGFSDHTQGHLASSLAVAFGACFFEKHFTLDNNFPGPDHWFSESPVGLKDWINSIKTSYEMMGSAIVKPTPEEEKMKKLVRRSIVALSDIEKGKKFDNDNVGFKRPGTGLPPLYLSEILGKKSTKNISKGTQIRLGDFS